MDTTATNQAPERAETKHKEGEHARADAPETVTFVEMRGATADDSLGRWAQEATRAGLACELLESEAERGLFLVVCRGRGGVPGVPEGARQWSFRSVGTYR